MATQSRLDESIARFKQNEPRFDAFINNESGVYQTSGGIDVEVIQQFLRRVEAALYGRVPTLTVSFATLALLNASGAPADPKTLAFVYNDVGANNGYYSWNGAAWAKTAMQPASQAMLDKVLAILAATDDPNLAYAFVDKFGNMIASIAVNGALDAGNISLRGMNGGTLEGAEAGLYLVDRNGFVHTYIDPQQGSIYGTDLLNVPEPGIFFTDKFGHVVIAISDGYTAFPSTEVPVQPTTSKSLVLGAQRRTDVMHVVVYGQSLSRGNQSAPAISVTQPYSNVMMAGGVLKRTVDSGYIADAYAPLVEFGDVGASEAETPTAGICNGTVRRIVEQGGDASKWSFLGSSVGQGGRTVDQLSPGGTSGRFEQMLNLIQNARDTAIELGKSYSVWAMAWYQGENDYATAEENNAQRYTEHWMVNMWQSFVDKAVEITGQEFQPYLYTYQVGSHRRQTFGRDMGNNIAISQWRASTMRPFVVMACPVYMFEHAADNLHLTNHGSWLMGEYTARALHHTMIGGASKWRPLEPTSVNWTVNSAVVKYHVPYGKIVIDNALVATTDNAGFQVYKLDNSHVPGVITSVDVTGTDEVTVNFSVAPEPDWVLTYGRGKPGDPNSSGPVTGGRGNVRDTHGEVDVAVSPTGSRHEMHNVSVMFQHSPRYGF